MLQEVFKCDNLISVKRIPIIVILEKIILFFNVRNRIFNNKNITVCLRS